MSECATTLVFVHANDEAARTHNSEIMTKWPMFAEEGDTRLSGVSIQDLMSATDAVRMALECNSLSDDERITLALELIDCPTWKHCQNVFSSWELRDEEGQLVTDVGEVA